jgi:pilus assembly protein Flp/PilA
MRDFLLREWIRFRHCDEGVTLVEYGVAVALAVAVGIGALTALGGDVTAAMGAAGAAMPN